MQKSLAALGLVALAVAFSGPAGLAQQRNGPFVIAGRAWVDQQAFIDAGRRCATRDLDEERRGQIAGEINARFRRPGGGGAPVQTGGAIHTYVHVITHSSGAGNPTTGQINAQIDVLNDAFASTGWSFTVVGTDVTANDAWFAMEPGTVA